MMKRTVREIHADYETIMSAELSTHQLNRQLVALMDEMEKTYNIPMQRNATWESENRTVIALYRKLSMSRKF